jgi:adenosine kinase
MSILISGSIAFDTIIQTVGNFRDYDIERKNDLHLSLFAPVVRREYGGTAANIAYSLSLLGVSPSIIATAGSDSGEYLEYLRNLGIQTELIHTIPTSPSLQSIIVHDDSHGQINIFHPGAMNMSGEISHGNRKFDIAIIAPDSPKWIVRRINECKESGIFSIFDPGQAMVELTREELITLASQTDITIMNEPERLQFESMTGQDFIDICLAHGHTGIVTLGDKWAFIKSQMSENTISGIYVENIVDATGCGDAFRAGLLYGLSEKWSLEKSITLGNIIGWIKIGYMWGQNHAFTHSQINAISEKEFGIKIFD